MVLVITVIDGTSPVSSLFTPPVAFNSCCIASPLLIAAGDKSLSCCCVHQPGDLSGALTLPETIPCNNNNNNT